MESTSIKIKVEPIDGEDNGAHNEPKTGPFTRNEARKTVKTEEVPFDEGCPSSSTGSDTLKRKSRKRARDDSDSGESPVTRRSRRSGVKEEGSMGREGGLSITPPVGEVVPNAHQRDQGHECSICKKRFEDKQQLKAHAKEHSGERPFACSVCDEGFTQRRLLDAHMKTHDEDGPHASSAYESSSIPTRPEEKPSICSFCGKALSRRELTLHMRFHEEDLKTFKCPVCKIRFALRNDLAKHVRMHAGEEPFSCDLCRRKFTLCSVLIRHRRQAHGVEMRAHE